MALFSSVSSPVLLEVSLGESVLKGPQHSLAALFFVRLHESSYRLLALEGAGGGRRLLPGLSDLLAAQIQLLLSSCSWITNTNPSRKPSWDPVPSEHFWFL